MTCRRTNFQEDPKPVVAHRTSPTNIGLYLLSTVAARDFGWLGSLDMLARLEATLETMGRLERFRGHFYNWYDTGDLRPLEPRYVSTVDSGNLAGHLLVLGSACASAIHRPLLDPEAFAGIEDALVLVGEAASALGGGRSTQTVTLGQLDESRRALAAALREPPTSPAAWAARLRQLAVLADTLVDIARTLTAERGDGEHADLLAWAEATRAAIASHERVLLTLMPWAPHLAAALSPLATAAPEAIQAIEVLLSSSPGPAELAAHAEAAARALAASRDARRRERPAQGDESALVDETIAALTASSVACQRLVDRLAAVTMLTKAIFDGMQFGFMFDATRKIFSIGYRITDGSPDPSGYDLLASEARLTSFIAIAKGDVPVSHWFHLGRPMTPVGHGAALLSWSGSMFEYLMPALVMRSPSDSLLYQTYRLVVRRQISYGAEQGVPWGISESAYNVRDLDLTYQYSNFGVPGLGLERGLSDDLVIAPYATALAAMIEPEAAAENLKRLADVGARGSYGFYEALDYTGSRLPEGATVAIVRAYMAHHQGMTLLALSNVLRKGEMRAWFHAEPIIQATELLLQERAPRDVAVARPRVEEVEAPAHARDFKAPVFRQFTSPHDPIRRTHLLSNGRYSVMLTGTGAGYSRCGGLEVTRWREDVTRDHWGTYIFVRDVRQRGGVVDRVSTHGGRAGRIPRHVLRGPRRVLSSRRRHHDRARGPGLPGRRRRGTPRLDHEPRRPGSRARADLLRRARPDFGGRRRRAPGVLQAFRPDGIAAPARGRPRDPPGPIARGAVGLGGPRGRGGGRVRRRRAVRDGPRAIPRARTKHPHTDVGDRRPAPVEHHGLRARSGREPQTPRSPPARRKCPPGLLDARHFLAGGRRGARRQVSRPGDLRPHGHPGVDSSAGAAAPSRDRPQRGAPVPGSRGPDPLLRPHAQAVRRHAEAQQIGGRRALALRNLR
jgi:hypothetical protein